MEMYKILRKLDILSIGDIPIAQSKVYLLTQLGVDLGYSFDWYGKPFNNRLSTFLHGFYFEATYVDGVPVEELVEGVVLDEAVLERIEVIELLDEYRPDNKTVKEWYSLLARLAYLYNNAHYFNLDLTVQSVVDFYADQLIGEEGWSVNIVDRAYWLLADNGFVEG